MKKKLAVLIFLLAFAAVAEAQTSKNSGNKNAAGKALKAMTEFADLCKACPECVTAVETDSIYGEQYIALKDSVAQTLKLLDSIDLKYKGAISILQQEFLRNPYNTRKERNDYKKELKGLRARRRKDINDAYAKIDADCRQIAKQQKAYYVGIVSRRVKKSIGE